jgi:hypothetical protein
MNHAAVSSLFPTPQLAPRAIADHLLKTLPRAQLAKSYETQLNHLAGPLTSRVQRVFGGVHAPLYLLTTPARRQVWNAVIAMKYPNSDLDRYREDLLEKKSRTLLIEAYRTLPRGFTTILNKCGEIGLEAGFYRFWHDYLTHYPEDLPFLAARDLIKERFTKALQDVPPKLGRLPVFAKVGDPKDLPRLVEAMTWVHAGHPAPELWSALAERLIAGEKPISILTKIIDEIICPPPYITGDTRFRHLGSVREMKATSLEFQNCLGSAFSLKDAVRGEDQYYEYRDGDDRLIVAITSDAPFGFTIDDIRAKQNERPNFDLKQKVEAALLEHGITRRKSLFDIVEDWEDQNPIDFDELFTFEP